MVVTYKWNINQMDANIQSEGESNVIYTVHYTYTGSTIAENGETFYAQSIGAETYTYVAGEPFTPYENTEAFESVVIGWLEGSCDIPSMQANIIAGLEAQIAPINEALYFSWQDPEPTPPPVIEPEEPIEEEEEVVDGE